MYYQEAIREAAHRAAGAANEAMKCRVNGGHQELIFILKVKIDGAISHSGAVGNFGHTGVEKAVLGNHFNGSIQNALVLV